MFTQIKKVDKFKQRPDLTCIHPTIKKDFNSGEAYFGILKQGYMVEVPYETIKYLLEDDCYLCEKLGEKF